MSPAEMFDQIYTTTLQIIIQYVPIVLWFVVNAAVVGLLLAYICLLAILLRWAWILAFQIAKVLAPP